MYRDDDRVVCLYYNTVYLYSIDMPYAELHCLSNFTFLKGASQPEELVRRAYELGYCALAITDECSLAGVVRAFDATRQYPVPLIIGSEFHLDALQLVLLATDHTGYSQLCQLITTGRRADRAVGAADGQILEVVGRGHARVTALGLLHTVDE